MRAAAFGLVGANAWTRFAFRRRVVAWTMRWLLLLLIPSAAAMPVTFDSPFLVSGDVELSGDLTFVALMRDGVLGVEGRTDHDLLTIEDRSFYLAEAGSGELPGSESREEVWRGQETAAAGTWEDSLVVVHGVSATWFGQGVAPTAAISPQACEAFAAGYERGAWIPLDVMCRSGGFLWTSASGGSVEFSGRVDALAYSDTTWSCATCPEEARWTATVHEVGGNEVAFHERRFGVLEGAMDVVLAGSPIWYMVLGTPDVTVDGKLLLHNPEGISACGACVVEDHVGLALYGRSSMEGLAPQGGRIGADVSGNWTAARVNEAPLEALVNVETGAAAAATIGLAIVVKVLAGLFTRISGEEALKHPKRQQLHQFIQENPGSNFRELLRGTEMAAGTARHHLTILRRAGLTTEERHKGTLRFFDGVQANWQAVVLLREPELRKLHGWIEANPGAMQRAILDHAVGQWGWSRSTTQHRLGRLVDGGLLDFAHVGRRKVYQIPAREAQRGTMLERMQSVVDASS